MAANINKIDSKDYTADQDDLLKIIDIIQGYFVQVLGINFESNSNNQSQAMEHLMNLIIVIRKDSRDKKDFATSDKIRDYLTQAGIELRDSKEGTSWKI